MADGGERLNVAVATEQSEFMPPNLTKWTPNEEYISIMQTMGISRNAAIKGLYFTGNFSVDAASCWVFDNAELPDLDQELQLVFAHKLEDQQGGESCKMVFVINKELSMGPGKVAAQVAHAAVSLYRVLSNGERYKDVLELWETEGQKKIVVGGENAAHLFDLERMAQSEGLACSIITDAGRTQVAPGSVTCFGVMGKVEDVDKITGTLRLL